MRLVHERYRAWIDIFLLPIKPLPFSRHKIARRDKRWIDGTSGIIRRWYEYIHEIARHGEA